MIYFSILILLILCEYINILTNHKYKYLSNMYLIAIGSILFLIAAFRDGIGYDFENYRKIFNLITIDKVPQGSSNVEWGFYLLNILSSSFSIVIFISALIAIPMKIKLICEYSEDGLLSLIMYYTSVFIMFDMGVIRQGIAIMFMLFSVKYIINRDFKKFLIVILCGSLFHITILVTIPLYFLSYIDFDRKVIYGASFIALVFSVFKVTTIVFKILAKLPLGTIAYKLNYYLNSNQSNLTMSLIKRIIFLVIFVEFFKRKKIKDKKSLIFLNGYFLSILIMGVFSSVDIIGGRGSMGLYFMQVFLFAIMMKRTEKKPLKLAIFAVVILLSINTMMGPINHGNSSNQPYTPYKSIFSSSNLDTK